MCRFGGDIFRMLVGGGSRVHAVTLIAEDELCCFHSSGVSSYVSHCQELKMHKLAITIFDMNYFH